MNEKIRGVNLGGWLILEKWITPGLFSGTDSHDEREFMKHPEGSRRIETHRKSFITEADFKWLAEHGINLVRIPVGYWLFEATDGHTQTVKYLDKAMKWSEKHNIKVLIDLHSAKGSQNGKDHSGAKGKADWFVNKSYQKDTIELLRQIAKRYADSPALWGIELLNEPKVGWHYFTLLRFYRHAYDELRKILRPGTKVVYHDGFHAVLFSAALRSRKSHPVMMDVHWYAFVPFGQDASRYRKLLSIYRKSLLRFAQLFQPIIVGEWSSVFPGRYFEQVPQSQHDELLRQNIDMQLDLFQDATGWVYWNYKHEAGGMWNFRSLVEQGILYLS